MVRISNILHDIIYKLESVPTENNVKEAIEMLASLKVKVSRELSDVDEGIKKFPLEHEVRNFYHLYVKKVSQFYDYIDKAFYNLTTNNPERKKALIYLNKANNLINTIVGIENKMGRYGHWFF